MEIVRVLADYLTFLCLFVLSNFMENVDGLTTADIGSPLRVAQCRVECISKFSRSSLHHKTCLHGSDCKMCWQNCQLLQSNFPVWGALCAEKALCYPGCEAACRFALATDNSQQRSPVLVRRAEEVLRVNGQDVRWPPPPSTTSSPPNTPYIYLVMRKSSAPGSAWKQLTQTIDLSARVPHDPGGMLRVLVVGREGLRTVYSPLPRSEGQPSARETAREVMRSLGREGRLLDVMEKSAVGAGKRINTARPVVAQKGVNWNLRLISKIHQQVLVIAEVAWDAQTTTAHVHKPLYLVTWEVEGGGIQGNLFTDVSCVTLSLWPNTVFHIQVELVNQQDSIALSKSEILLVDTRPALDAITEHQPHVKVLNVATTEPRPQFFSGAAAALVSFLILLLVLACTRHCLLDRVIAHSKLNEDLPYGPNLHRVFPPVVTIVQDMRRPSTSKLVTLKKDDIDDWDSS